MIKLCVLTISDKCFAKERFDKSGNVIIDSAQLINAKVIDYQIIPDDTVTITNTLIYLSDNLNADLILTTGGTGFSPLDNTPEATLEVIERNVPGIPEAIRQKSMSITPTAMLSRSIAGIRGSTLIINLPGSPKAVSESLDIIIPVLPHAIQILKGQSGECAAK